MTELEKLKMNDDYINQNDIVKRYLHNKLTPEETVEFEEYMLDKPELLERLELDMVLIETLPRIKSSKRKIIFLRSSLFRNMLAFGACLAVVSVLLIRQTVSQRQNYSSPNIVYLESYRSASTVTSIDFTKDRSPIMVVDTSDFIESRFDVLIQNPDGSTYELVSALLINQSNEIVFSIEDKSLLPANSKIIVRPTNSDKPALSFNVTSILNNQDD